MRIHTLLLLLLLTALCPASTRAREDSATPEDMSQRIERLAAETIARAEELLAGTKPETQASMRGPVIRALLAEPVGPSLLNAEQIPAANLAEGWPILLPVLYERGYRPRIGALSAMEQTAHNLLARYRTNPKEPTERSTLEAALQIALIIAHDSRAEERVLLAQEMLSLLRRDFPEAVEGEQSLLPWREQGDDWEMALEFMLADPKAPSQLDPETFTAGLTLALEGDPPTDYPKPDPAKLTRDEMNAATREQIIAIRTARIERTLDRQAVRAHLEASGVLATP